MDKQYICPRCGGGIPTSQNPGAYPGAISRWDNTTEVCSACGTQEALLQILASLEGKDVIAVLDPVTGAEPWVASDQGAIIDDEELWIAVFGAGVEANGFITVDFDEGDWDEPGVATVAFIDGAEDIHESGVVTARTLRAAYVKACDAGIVDACTKTPLAEVTEANFDICCAEAVLQVAILGEVVWG